MISRYGGVDMRYLTTALLALSLLLYSCSSDSDQADDQTQQDSEGQSEEATETAPTESEPAESSPRGSEIGAGISLAPAQVPAVRGPVEVTIDGHGFGTASAVFVLVCPGLQGDPDAPRASGDISAECEMTQSAKAARDQGMQANVKLDPVDGVFTATLTVPITDDAIADGGVVIVAGDIFMPFWVTELLAIE